LIEFENLELGN